ncbi:MAG: VCBS repeat-containing protein [Planctomycetes bacterium]|nr:VCBS repeat-containing protein [Planctomycetota bacterium]
MNAMEKIRTIGLATILLPLAEAQAAPDGAWVRKRLPGPNAGNQQTACIVLDVDGDGTDDFVVAERTKTPSVVWYKYNGTGWDRRTIDDTPLKPEAGGVACDVDRDGDPDVIFGQDASGSAIWWWENPRPSFGKPWVRRIIKEGGPPKHHDQTVADYDGDGRVEFVSWNQKGRRLLFYEIPADPKGSRTWPSTTIYSWSSGQELEGFPSAPVDVDGDGVVDPVGGGRWFERKGDGSFEAHVIDDAMRFTQCAAGQLVEGGRPEIVFSPGDMDGDAKWYAWDGKRWVPHTLRRVIHGHTCEIRDADRDGHADILIGEMGNPGHGDASETWIWYGDGKGGFEEVCISRGQGIHEGLFGDFDGDGDLDVLMKPYNHNSPRIDILLNPGGRGKRAAP